MFCQDQKTSFGNLLCRNVTLAFGTNSQSNRIRPFSTNQSSFDVKSPKITTPREIEECRSPFRPYEGSFKNSLFFRGIAHR